MLSTLGRRLWTTFFRNCPEVPGFLDTPFVPTSRRPTGSRRIPSQQRSPQSPQALSTPLLISIKRPDPREATCGPRGDSLNETSLTTLTHRTQRPATKRPETRDADETHGREKGSLEARDADAERRGAKEHDAAPVPTSSSRWKAPGPVVVRASASRRRISTWRFGSHPRRRPQGGDRRVPAKDLFERVKMMPDGPIQIATQDNVDDGR